MRGAGQPGPEGTVLAGTSYGLRVAQLREPGAVGRTAFGATLSGVGVLPSPDQCATLGSPPFIMLPLVLSRLHSLFLQFARTENIKAVCERAIVSRLREGPFG